jgi:thiol-disulfide isomerase/thioredoxin
MKLLSILLLFITINANSQTKFQVKGEIKGVPDGEIVALYRYRDGSIDAASVDTLYKGKFLLSDTVSHPTLYWILGSGNTFPSCPLQIWAAPGLAIRVSGKGNLLKTWQVTSSLPEQHEENQYLSPSVANWNKVQEIQIKRRQPGQARLSHEMDSILATIDRVKIGLLQKRPVTDIWLNKMQELSFELVYNPTLSYREKILQLYKRLTDQQRTSPIGGKITANLFPPAILKIGDTLPDIALLDTQMVVRKLTEYEGMGKYLLLDFGFINCGACRLAIPETKELYDSLITKLTIIGINVDETAYWKSKSAEFQSSWVSLNDSMGRSGLAGRFGVKGYPYYVLVSPFGIVLGAWMGYEKGELTRNVMRTIK